MFAFVLNRQYIVDIFGNVYPNKNMKDKKDPEIFIGKDGYWILISNKKLFSIHRLIAKAFIPNPKNKPHINHLNSEKTDNRISNLEWCTAKENTRHSIDGSNGKYKTRKSKTFTREQMDNIISDRKSGFIFSELSLKYNASRSTIANIITGKIVKGIDDN